MILMHILKILIDLSFFYTFAVTIGIHHSGSSLLFCALLQSISFGLSSLFGENKVYRVLALLPIGLCWYVSLGALTDMAALLSTSIYMLYLTVKGDYSLSLSRQRRIFQIYCTIAPLFLGIMAVGGMADGALAAMPFVFITLAVSIMMMRSLRHDPAVFQQRSYQLFNGASICGIFLAAYIASLDIMLQGLLKLLGWIFHSFLEPILTLFAQMIAFVVYLVIMILSKAGVGRLAENRAEDMSLEDFSAYIDDSILADANQDNDHILIIIGVILGVAVVFFFFRWLAKSYRDKDGTAVVMESRQNIFESINGKKAKRRSGARSVRGIYRRFLKLCTSKGMEILYRDTSSDVEQKAAYYLPKEENIVQMRNIYIRHRYGGELEKEDVRRMKKLYQEIKGEIKKK